MNKPGSVNISGGTINGPIYRSGSAAAGYVCVLTGGRYSEEPYGTYIPDGYVATNPVDGYWSVVTASEAYSVSISDGANATLSSGKRNQKVIIGNAITDVVYTANTGKYFPEFDAFVTSGLTVTRTSPSTVTISGTPTNNASITVPDAANKLIPSFYGGRPVVTLTYGQTLSQSVVTATVVESGTSKVIKGIFTWDAPYASKVPEISESGSSEYRVNFVPNDTETYSSVDTNISLVVNKVTPEFATLPTATLTLGQTLGDSALSGTARGNIVGEEVAGAFTWSAEDSVKTPTIDEDGSTDYSVTFTPNNTDIYETVNTNVTLRVNKVLPTVVTYPSASEITYGQTLGDSVISGAMNVPGTFTWSSANPASTTRPAVADSESTTYVVLFTPSDTDSYATMELTVKIKVNPATPSITTLPTASAITVGSQIGSSVLSGGEASVAGTFTWKDPTGIAPTAGTTTRAVVFTPSSDNYSTVEMNVTIEVISADVDPSDDHLGGYSLSLEGDIGVYFYIELSDELANSDTAYMQFTIPNGGASTVADPIYVKDVDKCVINGKTYYKFKCNVSAKDINSVITAQIKDTNYEGDTYTYTVTQYAMYVISNASSNAEYKRATPLVKALLNYGTTAQTLFGVTGEGPANAGLDDGDKDISGTSIPEPEASAIGLQDGVTFIGATLSLKTETTLSLYFTGIPRDTEFTCVQGNRVETDTSGEYVIARIRGINARNLGNSYTVTFGANSVTYSPMNYCYNAFNLASSSEALRNVCWTVYRYRTEADAYFGSNN
ncbi:MAG: hypothetical protein J6Z43_09020 [Clostridiales bacterium]|nr:hypothetical protein [Clostridiales bacterium]